MTEEKQGAAEWLRGIIDESYASGTRSCVDIAKVFGIDCKHERTCRDCKIDMMTAIADRIDREMAEKERLKKENAELMKAELADWKGNAEGFQPDAYMKLPLDADGVPIRVGDEVVDLCGEYLLVVDGYCKLPTAEKMGFTVEGGRGVYEPSAFLHKKPEPADSWEKLEEDVMRGTSCHYFGCVESAVTCFDCHHGAKQTGRLCWKNERIDILKRAKKLAGIEEEARND